MTRLPRLLAPLALTLFGALAVLGSGCSGPNPYQASQASTTMVDTIDEAPLATNVFTPDRNLSSCVGTMERPDCGAKSKGGWRMYLTFGVLIGGLGFVGWHVVRSIRQRDAAVNPRPE